MALSNTAPLRQELEKALAARPFAIDFWDGSRLPATNGAGPTFTVRSPGAVAHLLRAPGQLGIGRAYASGLLEPDDLDATLDLLDNWKPPEMDRATRTRLALAAVRACGLTRPPPIPAAELRPRGRRHSPERDARAVRHHYDVGNEYFALFLDESMTYSCAIFSRGAKTLEEAQEAKLEMVCTKLGLREGERVLDVGCGWGSFALHAAGRHGVQVLGITLSEDQAALARRRAAEAGLEDRIEIRVADYRELRTGSPSTRSPASAWSSTWATARSTSMRAASRGCYGRAAGCSTTASPACGRAIRRPGRSPSATSSRMPRRCTSRGSCWRWSAPGS